MFDNQIRKRVLKDFYLEWIKMESRLKSEREIYEKAEQYSQTFCLETYFGKYLAIFQKYKKVKLINEEKLGLSLDKVDYSN